MLQTNETRTLISVSTYKRPRDLSRFIKSVLPQLDGAACSLLVVDNSPEAEARAYVESFKGLVQYAHEPLPGIAATRNRGLVVADSGGYEWLIFVDDDEWTASNWLQQIQIVADENDDGVIVGPAVTVYDSNTPSWIKRYGFHQRVMLSEGAHPKSTATHNTLLKMSQWRSAGKPLFDHAFSLSGGSDTDFFTRLTQTGITIRYTQRAIVYEEVPPNRANIKWLTRRGIRIGAVHARIALREQSNFRLFGQGMLRIAKGVALLPVDLVARNSHVATSYATLLRGLGMCLESAHLFSYTEYSRAS